MFAAIFIPDFPVEAILRLKPELRERPVAVMEGTPPLLRVIAVNERAAGAGLETGMTKLQAGELVPACKGVLAMRSPEQEASAQAALLDAACGFSPRVEDTAPGLVVIDLEGLERIFGPVAKMARDIARRCSEIGLEAQVAAASNPDAAIHAARGFSGVTVIPEGREAERLASLPVDVLTVIPLPGAKLKTNEDPSGLLDTFERWGVRSLRALAALPEVAVTERLGQAGLHWQRMARGATVRALELIDPPARFEETCELEYPVESLEPLSFLLNRMLEQLCSRLSARALASNELRIKLGLDTAEDFESPRRHEGAEDVHSEICYLKSKGESNREQNCKFREQQTFTRSLRLPVPMLDAKVFLKLLQLDLQAHPPGAPVVKVSIQAEPAEPRRSQDGLFQPQAPEPERLEVTLARIQSAVNVQGTAGDGQNRQPAMNDPQCGPAMRVGSAEILDTHRPDTFRVKRFAAPSATGHRPPVRQAAHPERDCKGGDVPVIALRLMRPPLAANVTLRAGKPARIECETVQGEITWAAGPWKSSGEWWSEEPWEREEWDVCVGGACYRIYREEKGWFVEGSYD